MKCLRAGLQSWNSSKKLNFYQKRWSARRTILRGEKEADNPWKILGVDRNIDEAGLKKAYHAMAIKYHPDRPGGSQDRFQKIKQAYDSIKSGEAQKQYSAPEASYQQSSDFSRNNAEWANGFDGFRATSSQSTQTFDGTRIHTYTYQDSDGRTHIVREVKTDTNNSFWQAFHQAQNEALKREAERMAQRAAANANFQRVFENWAAHKINETADYQRYVAERDRAFVRFFIAWFMVFLFLRITLNTFAR